MSFAKTVHQRLDRLNAAKKAGPETRLKMIRGFGKGLERLCEESEFSTSEYAANYSAKFRASQIYEMCPQRWVFNYWQPQLTEVNDYRMRYYTGFGTFLHDSFQKSLLPATGAMRGSWVVDSQIIEGYPTDEQAPLFMDRGLTVEFEEDSLWDKHWRLSGHCDGIVSIQRLTEFLRVVGKKPLAEVRRIVANQEIGEEALLEIKTISSKKIGGLKAAEDIRASYRAQASLYQKHFGLSKTVFLYVARDNGDMKALIYEGEQPLVDECYRKMERCLVAIRDETLPSSGEKCAKQKDAEKERCLFAECCFYPLREKRFREEYVKNSTRVELLDFTNWTPENNTPLKLVKV